MGAKLKPGRYDCYHNALANWPARRAEAAALADPAWNDDRPLPEDAAIAAAHPLRSGDHARYMEALRLVGAKRSKCALVDLVSWLLSRIPAAQGGESA